ncbi:FBP domain-containing protein [Rathayibacter sp. YIM 133350]|uniref:FBP domain-containing protein n=1 Tax=Rathayibacter sp. YIM 133350 TaxID=3131992 RepID=UPI00307D1E9E
MRPLTEDEIRSSFVNQTPEEARSIALPVDYLLTEWEHIDFLGWRDPRAPRRGYLVTEKNGRPLGVVLRAAESVMPHNRSAYCSLCHTLQPADQVSLFTARRTGEAGEAGNTVGQYICADLSCPENVRLGAPLAPLEVPASGYADARVSGLAERAGRFVESVLA